VVAAGADLAPGTLLTAYRQGLFPMPAAVPGGLLWWSPDPRGIIDLGTFRPSRSLRRSRRRFEVRIDSAFREVMEACAAEPRPGGWITPAFVDAYTKLHELGWAHSVEVLDDTGRLVGGLYGVGIGGFFAGESMFHRATDASKVALWALVEALLGGGATLLDVQWATDHLRTLGAVDLPRPQYLQLLADAVSQPVSPFAGRPPGPSAD
jgi:leucyl/phenylalanyl-tRNA---protein transferase